MKNITNQVNNFVPSYFIIKMNSQFVRGIWKTQSLDVEFEMPTALREIEEYTE